MIARLPDHEDALSTSALNRASPLKEILTKWIAVNIQLPWIRKSATEYIAQIGEVEVVAEF